VTEEREEITIAEIAQLYNAGSVTGETLVWAEGMDDWMPYEQARSLLPSPRNTKRWSIAVLATKLSLGMDSTIMYEVDHVTEEREEITIAEIAQLYTEGVVTGETLVWAEGMEDWLT